MNNWGVSIRSSLMKRSNFVKQWANTQVRP